MELAEIKIIRKKLELTQSELAKRADVSQSLIAKIESDKIDPTFTNVQKIFNTLNELSKKEEILADKIMSKKIISIEPDESLGTAIKKMKKYEISQMPVIQKENVIGLVSESTILESLMKEDNTNLKVKDVMTEAPPTIPKNATKDMIIELLKYFPLLLVKEKGIIKGVITKSDLLASLYK